MEYIIYRHSVTSPPSLGVGHHFQSNLRDSSRTEAGILH